MEVKIASCRIELLEPFHMFHTEAFKIYKFLLQVAVFLAPAIAIPFILFSGFFINLSAIPVYMSWMAYSSFMRYAFEGSLVAVYGFNRAALECSEPYCHFRMPIKILEQFDMEQSVFAWCIMALLVGFVLVRLAAYLVLKWRLRHIRWLVSFAWQQLFDGRLNVRQFAASSTWFIINPTKVSLVTPDIGQ